MQDLWPQCKQALENIIPAQHFKTWVRPLVGHSSENQLTIAAPNVQVLRWIKSNLQTHIEAFLLSSDVSDIAVSFVLAENVEAPTAIKPEVDLDRPQIKKNELPKPIGFSTQNHSDNFATNFFARGEEIKLKPEFEFNQFVPGKANQLAVAAAQQVAENPGSAYNPLFIYGGTGLGKTHLLHAIGLQMLAKNPRARIRYIHTEQFVTDVVSAYQNKSFEALKSHYRTLDLLLIDDIQFFVGKNRSQEEFFYTFNALFEGNKQVVLTSDSYPREIQGIEERLKSRFGWGLTVAVEPPELEMRVAILIRKAESEGLSLPEDVAFFIANTVRSNVRELEGALKQVIAYTRFHQQPLSLHAGKEALRNLLAVVSRQISIENIQKTVAEFYKIKVADMYSQRRTRNIARPRQIAMALAKELTHHSLPEIGDAFNKDHTTVLHACRKIDSLRIEQPQISREYDQLSQVLTR